MEMIHFAEWLPKPGELLEFVPEPGTVEAAAAAPASPVPPSFIQDFHIRYWRDRRRECAPDEVAATVRTELSMCFSIAAALDREALRQAFTDFLRRHDSLRCRFDVHETTMTRHVLDAGAVALRTVPAGAFPSGEQLRDRLAARFQAPDPEVWPAFACGAIDHGPDGFTVYFSIDHAFSDGMSLVAAIAELHRLYTARTDRRPRPLPPVAGYTDHARAERELVDSGPPELDRLATILAENADHVRPLPWDLGLAPGAVGDSTGRRTDLLTGAQYEAFAAACADGGGTFTAGLYAAVALAELESDGRTRYLGLNVIGTRTDPRFRFTHGWFINLLPVAFDVGTHARFTEVVGRARGALDAIKPLADIPLPAALDRAAELTGRPLPPVRDWPWVSYMDMRQISGAELERSLPGLHGIRGLGSRSRIGQPSPLWFNREADRVHVAVMFPDTERAHASVGAYLDRLRTVLVEIAETGDFASAATRSGA
ncbi:condensation domain-containing protein [Nocardia sp. BMG51109]|uniref:condensation domain-containing protein n=1 Tax=Nocardia sp. BMG51109 TaxID=1056816 RepID=UPI0004B99158|nr:condensation domain-containing protein [Nocardia sp. BMG51109]